MKKPYGKPTVSSEDVYETLAAGCTYFTTADPLCDPDQNPDPLAKPMNS